jgi:hypothetical protein
MSPRVALRKYDQGKEYVCRIMVSFSYLISTLAQQLSTSQHLVTVNIKKKGPRNHSTALVYDMSNSMSQLNSVLDILGNEPKLAIRERRAVD